MVHRASTKSLQIALSWTSRVSSLPTNISIPHLFHYRYLPCCSWAPLLLLLWDVHVSTVLACAVVSIFSTGPSHLHRLCCKMIAIASCPVAHWSLALDILLGQSTRMIFLRQVLWKVANLQLSFSVILQHSDQWLVNDSQWLSGTKRMTKASLGCSGEHHRGIPEALQWAS